MYGISKTFTAVFDRDGTPNFEYSSQKYLFIYCCPDFSKINVDTPKKLIWAGSADLMCLHSPEIKFYLWTLNLCVTLFKNLICVASPGNAFLYSVCRIRQTDSMHSSLPFCPEGVTLDGKCCNWVSGLNRNSNSQISPVITWWKQTHTYWAVLVCVLNTQLLCVRALLGQFKQVASAALAGSRMRTTWQIVAPAGAWL